jgi:uncharacterized membrane protein
MAAEDILYSIPQEVIGNLSSLITILQALGVAIIVYITFSIINLFFTRKRDKELKKISENIEIIKEKFLSK